MSLEYSSTGELHDPAVFASVDNPRIDHRQPIVRPFDVLQKAATVKKEYPGDARQTVMRSGLLHQLVQLVVAEIYCRLAGVCDCLQGHFDHSPLLLFPTPG